MSTTSKTQAERDVAASIEHQERIAAKRRVLEDAQVATESQIIQAVRRLWLAGHLTAPELYGIFQQCRANAMPGFSAAWCTALGVSQQLMYQHARNVPNGPLGTWEGDAPLPTQAVCPPRGQSVVYVLYDQASVPCYVGSSEQFRDRLKAHVRDGKPVVRWRAYPCPDRAAAYEMEGRLLREHMPYLNLRRGA